MTIDEAKELLSCHSGSNENIDDPRWKNGFLGMLKPYQGHLIEKNFHEVIDCLRTLADSLNEEKIDNSVVCDVMGIITWLGHGVFMKTGCSGAII